MVKRTMVNYIKRGPYDELFTPPEAVIPLLKYLPKQMVYWECTDFGYSNITSILRANDFIVKNSHIQQNIDFLKDDPPFHYDAIITNPPYSMKDLFLERAYSLNKPFCFLMPITTLEGVKRGMMFRKYGVQLLVLDKRINFMKNKKNVWFNTSWFCWKILPKDLIFEKVLEVENAIKGVK